MAVRDNLNSVKGGVELRWNASALSTYINLKNTGKIKLKTIQQSTGGSIGVYGTNSPNTLSHVSNVTHLTTFETTNAGHTAEYKLDKSYPYIVLYAVYKTNGWNAVVDITT